MSITALGYVVIETAKRREWERFLTRVAGAMKVPGANDGVDLYRIDGRPFRFWVEESDREFLKAGAFEVLDADTWRRLAETIAATGRPVEAASPEEAAARGVAALFRTTDPAGNGLEFFHGDSAHDASFVSPAGVSGFVTGKLGLGHVVFAVPDFAASHAFYRQLGLGDSDLPSFFLLGPDGPEMHFAFMHGAAGRHHSVALGEGPVPPSGCIHIMLEMKTIADVGAAYDRMRAEGFVQSASLGQHVNDEMIGFYVQTPGGFDLEIGCNGLVIDPHTWQTTKHSAISQWGHVWAWQEAMNKPAQ